MLIGTCSLAEEVYVIRGVNFGNFWKKKVIDEEKVLSVGQKIMMDNKIELKGFNTLKRLVASCIIQSVESK